MKTIEDRIGALERSNRQHRYVSIALALVVLAAVSIAGGPRQDETDPDKKAPMREFLKELKQHRAWTEGLLAHGTIDVIRAKKFEVVNDDGQSLVKLTTAENGEGMVVIQSPKGQVLVELNATEHGGAVGVQNKTGQRGCTMVVDEHGKGQISVRDRNGKFRTLTPGP